MESGLNNNLNNMKTIQVPNYSGVNIQIFNPTVAANDTPNATVNSTNYTTNPLPQAYPANYYTQNFNKPIVENNIDTTKECKSSKTENKASGKKEIVELTDEYVKTLEYYLNSQNIDVRTMAAKEVLDRMKEDKTRKNNPVLIAFNNKMLKDPKQPIRFMAMGAIESGYVSGDTETLQTLNQIKSRINSENAMVQADAVKAAKALVQLTKTTKEVE